MLVNNCKFKLCGTGYMETRSIFVNCARTTTAISYLFTLRII